MVNIIRYDFKETLRYFNASKERIFIRTKTVLWKKGKVCHPEKSINKFFE